MQRISTLPQAHTHLRWRRTVADILLAGLLLGPLVTPFLATTTLPLLPIVTGIIYSMGSHVCPQPQLGLMLAPPFMMAVCMRCYGTLLGLVATRLLYAANGGAGPYWLKQYGWSGALITGLLLLAYPAELAAQAFGLWSFNNSVMTLFGLASGVGLGLFLMPALYTPSRYELVDKCSI